jgi:hypothetical protein
LTDYSNLKDLFEAFVVQNAPSGVAPVVGTFSSVGSSAALTPLAGRGLNIEIGTPGASLGGSIVELHRALDGTNFKPLTYPDGTKVSFNKGVSYSRSEDQVGVPYKLVCVTFVANVPYRMSQ